MVASWPGDDIGDRHCCRPSCQSGIRDGVYNSASLSGRRSCCMVKSEARLPSLCRSAMSLLIVLGVHGFFAHRSDSFYSLIWIRMLSAYYRDSKRLPSLVRQSAVQSINRDTTGIARPGGVFLHKRSGLMLLHAASAVWLFVDDAAFIPCSN